ncbi:MAG: histidine kinase, partial [Clostridia bacterium]|nr:histidine kinase [Clostridia bacterium]
MGILILMIHIVNLLTKKAKRSDEKNLLIFFCFTVFHFATYLTFTHVKSTYTSNAYIIAFYTIFYIMNNIEVLLLFRYMRDYVDLSTKLEKILTIINCTVFAIFIVLDIVNIFTGIFFTAEEGVYLRSKTMIISQGYQFIMFVIIFLVTAFNKKLNIREKIAFALYCFLPLVAIILQNLFKGYAIAYASIIVSIEVLFFFVNVQKNVDLAKEEEKNKEAQIKIMLSQIQPHFIYNSLSSISTLITIDPEKAQKALDDFTEYLRRNLSSLTETKLIPFEDELKHIKTYVSLEKMRFGDRVDICYNIQTTDFSVPTLSLLKQMLYFDFWYKI